MNARLRSTERRRRRLLALAACLAVVLLAAAGGTGCHQHGLEVIATFDGGRVTAADLSGLIVAPEDTTHTAALVSQVETAAARVAEERILLAVAEHRGLRSEPTLDLQVRTAVAASLAFDRLREACPEQGGEGGEIEAIGRRWIDVQQVHKRLDAETSRGRRERARSELEKLIRQLDEGRDFESLARRHSDDGGELGRIYRDSVLDPRVLEAAWALEDGQHSGIVDTVEGLRLLRRVRSGTEPAPRYRRFSDRMSAALALVREIECPAAELPSGSPELVVHREALAPGAGGDALALEIEGEAFDRQALESFLSALGTPMADAEALLGDLARIFDLAASQLAIEPSGDERRAALEADEWDQALSDHVRADVRRSLVALRPAQLGEHLVDEGDDELRRETQRYLLEQHGYRLDSSAVRTFTARLGH